MKIIVHKARSLQGMAKIPSDKSISHRALIFGAIAKGRTHIRNWLSANATWHTLDCMRLLGVDIEITQDTQGAFLLIVHGKGPSHFIPPNSPLFCGHSATTMRLLMGLLAAQPFTVTIDGDDVLRHRPMERIAIPLRQMGATVSTTKGGAPIYIHGGTIQGIEYHMPVASAQLQTAVLLAGLFANEPTVLYQPGPARDHSIRLLQYQGADIQDENGVITLRPKPEGLKPLNLTVPGDMSSAAFLMVAATIVPNSTVKLIGVDINPTRTGLIDVLKEMGGDIQIAQDQTHAIEPVADLSVRHADLTGIQICGTLSLRTIDEFPILALAALCAQGQTIVRDARELRVKDSDRIAALVREFAKLGAKISDHPDGFEILGPQKLRGAVVSSSQDHRIAMSLIIAGLVAEDQTIIENVTEVEESFPNFIFLLQSLGANVKII